MDASVTVHGFRSSFRDWVAEATNTPGEVAEAALAHTVPRAVERTYKRTDFFENRPCLYRMAEADPVWSWFVIHAQQSLLLMDEILGKRAIRHLQRVNRQGVVKIVDAELAGRLMLASFLTLMRAMLDQRTTKRRPSRRWR